ncbi:MAG: adenine-specific methyltransferase EcoRI family protein [Deltaproteobacteria bacterium]|jgi:hypothetical protein|nr:adenine-specific methyltransferase EcoRI family protein [Deltaproteobacteria bacterium]
MGNVYQKGFGKAKKSKNDEFYTQMIDIEKELVYYKEHFCGKVVLCNCDDPFESNFFKYFATNFNFLKLRRLVATGYAGSGFGYGQIGDIFGLRPEIGEDASKGRRGFKIVVNEVNGVNGVKGVNEVNGVNGFRGVNVSGLEGLVKNKNNELALLGGNGDFRSAECLELLKEADLVVTNPPFSLFREFIAKLLDYEKKFLVIGNVNAVGYKEIFPLIMKDKIWLGQSIHGGDREFRVPATYPLEAANFRVDGDGNRYIRVKGVRWFTNLDVPVRHDRLILSKRYRAKESVRYDNYDAIEVGLVSDIPYDYDGLMCVPITFLDKYNPDQFRILGITDRQNSSGLRTKKYSIKDSDKYSDMNGRGVIKTESGYETKYARLIIKRRD